MRGRNFSIGAGELVGAGLGAWISRIGLLFVVALPCGLLPVVHPVFDGLLSTLRDAVSAPDEFLGHALAVFVTVWGAATLAEIVAGAATRLVGDAIDGLRVPAHRLLRELWPRALPVLGSSLFVGWLIAVALGLPIAIVAEEQAFEAFIGTRVDDGQLILIAGIVGLLPVPVLLMFGLAPQVAAREEVGLFGALRRSLQLTRNMRSTLFLAGVGACVVATGIGMAILLPTREIDLPPGVHRPFVTVVESVVFTIVVGVLASIAGATYHTLRTRTEGFGEEALLAIFK